MMARVNGWAVRWRNASARERRDVKGDNARTIDNKPLRMRKGLPLGTDFQAVALDADDANLLEALLEVGGHHFAFDVDAHSDAGLGPDTLAAGNWSILPAVPSSLDGVHGMGFLNVVTSLVWDAELPQTGWSVLYWRTVTATPVLCVVVDDGRKIIDGVRSDATTTTELTVADGAVALSAGNYDDLVILPYRVTDEFAAAFYRWTTGKRLSMALHYADGSGRDIGPGLVANGSAQTTKGIRRLGGRFGGCLSVTVAVDDYCNYNGLGLQASGSGQASVSVEDWVYLETAQVVATRCLADRRRGTANGWKLIFTDNGNGTFKASGTIATSGGDMTIAAPSTSLASLSLKEREARQVVGDEWVHVVWTFNTVTGKATLYVNAVDVGRSGAVDVAPGVTFNNETANSLDVGKNSSGTESLAGRSSGLRFYHTALTAAEVLEHFRAGLVGHPPPGRRPFSSLPRIELCGDLTGSVPRIVLGAVVDEPVLQKQSESGAAWVNNARDVSVSFDEVIDRDVERLSSPLWAINTSDAHVDVSLAGFLASLQPVHPVAGALGDANMPTQAAWAVGVTIRGPRSMRFTSFSNSLELPEAYASCLYRSTAASWLAWVRPTSLAATRGIVGLSWSGTSPKFDLALSTTGQVLLRAEPDNVLDTQRTLTSVGTVALSRWHLVGGFCDVTNDLMGVFADGAGLNVAAGGFYETSAQVFVSTVFDDAAAVDASYLGCRAGGTSSFSGEIQFVGLYPRVITAAEVLQHYRAGLRGALR